jgi:hypothetical protein
MTMWPGPKGEEVTRAGEARSIEADAAASSRSRATTVGQPGVSSHTRVRRCEPAAHRTSRWCNTKRQDRKSATACRESHRRRGMSAATHKACQDEDLEARGPDPAPRRSNLAAGGGGTPAMELQARSMSQCGGDREMRGRNGQKAWRGLR